MKNVTIEMTEGEAHVTYLLIRDRLKDLLKSAKVGPMNHAFAEGLRTAFDCHLSIMKNVANACESVDAFHAEIDSMKAELEKILEAGKAA